MHKKFKSFLSFFYPRSLFVKLGLMVLLFAFILIIINYQVITLSYTEQDTILDAHEFYYYSEMIQSWGLPPDTIKVYEDLTNLQLSGCIVFDVDKDSTVYWNFPKDFFPAKYRSYSDSEWLGEIWNVDIPLYVSFGDMESKMITYAENGDYRYYLAINYEEPDEFFLRFITASSLTLFFGMLLFLFIKKYLEPINLIRHRIFALEKGDLDSKINVSNVDELGELSQTINLMISNIKSLLTQKQQLLADVSHELMSPLTRMQLLIEFFPDNKNKPKLKNEIMNLRNIILNLLLSDKLDRPYTNLDLMTVEISSFLDKIIAKYPETSKKIIVFGSIPNKKVNIDPIKMDIAIKNILDNAIKYGEEKKNISIKTSIIKDSFIIKIHNFGSYINESEITKVFLPFYRGKDFKSKNIIGFGLGLAISKKISEAHGGTTVLKSNKESGTTCSLSFKLNL